MDNLLISEEPLIVLPKLAAKIGLNEAIVLQQMHYWLVRNKNKGINLHKGRYWTYNTYEDWTDNFPFWSSRTIRRIIKNLEELDLLISDNFNKYKYDRTKWYSVNYANLRALEFQQADKVSEGSGQDVHNKVDNVSCPIPEISSETSSETSSTSTFSTEDSKRIELFRIEYVKRFNKLYRETKRTSFNNEIIKDLDINEFPIYVRMFFDEMDNDINKCTIEYMDKAINRLIR